ncbi:hypothetical protein [Rhizobium leguminosarum]|uniref:hypothetical protein n=1 Tax=Rhizobium leguminosarum TaxID=384 RepID=UPI0010315B23|nr:hypothetical protein [Rhizobium leguminosarum]TAU90976.1 hypothetical protein ELI41_21730 [Rhizobium leguminosarum]TAV55635.1 hypothetical protein ELI29_22470 [Rhizobium leguminosarum]
MPSTFRIKDGLSQLGIRKPFGVNDDGVHAFECLRLLCGTVNLENKANGSVIKLRNCFLTQTVRKLKLNSLKQVVSSAFDGEISIDDAEKYLNKTSGINRDFWMKVKGELCLALACWSEDQHTRAFLHIYRLIEMPSVALPLFYASVEHDYYKSLDFLKGLPQNPRDGDLAIFRKFIAVLAKEGGYQNLRMEVFYSKGNLAWDARYTRQIQDYVISAERLNSSIDTATSKIDVPYNEFPSFFVTFRNRLFHNMLSAENFDLDKLGGSDAACEPLIKPALNWFTLTLCVILKQNAARYI